MGLLMKSSCEKCEAVLKNHAYICVHECTFCEKCTHGMSYVCPNCDGELVRRPKKRIKKALILIDVQKAFLDSKWGDRNNPNAEKNIQALLTEWRERKYEVIFIRHLSEDPQSLFYKEKESSNILDLIKPLENEKIITKKVNSAFIGTSLESHLKDMGIKEVVITGFTTPHCVSTTTRMSGNLGFQTYLISDATVAYPLMNHNGEVIDAQTVHDGFSCYHSS
ncbi:hypothetical protein BACCIP111883_02052 [Sutcliffiella rhizosphaerae]|uniref:RING-type domain-containing protein n=1 Tax=Sutcliffiella rhizosphaerae TaxID=2880967 RepID=A0ABM8YMV5_9BACI|nr:hypothetical protein BACCIP111883_02052 [Sutcliffiella rhizosphaerae]